MTEYYPSTKRRVEGEVGELVRYLFQNKTKVEIVNGFGEGLEGKLVSLSPIQSCRSILNSCVKTKITKKISS